MLHPPSTLLRTITAVIAAFGAGEILAQERVLEKRGERVEISVSPNGTSSAAICLEAGKQVESRKRLTIRHEGRSTELTASGANPGPHCAFLELEEEAVLIRLEHRRLVLFSATLAELELAVSELRGRTLTFEWVRE